mgnify:CR=1 FL=1
MNGKSIFSQLPNDLIIKIIGQTKGFVQYKQDHADEMAGVCWAIENVGEKVEENIHWDYPEADQFFCELFNNEALTDTIVKYRRSRSPLACLLGIPTSWLGVYA